MDGGSGIGDFTPSGKRKFLSIISPTIEGRI
jgi:hypothetical protein